MFDLGVNFRRVTLCSCFLLVVSVRCEWFLTIYFVERFCHPVDYECLVIIWDSRVVGLTQFNEKVRYTVKKPERRQWGVLLFVAETIRCENSCEHRRIKIIWTSHCCTFLMERRMRGAQVSRFILQTFCWRKFIASRSSSSLSVSIELK